MQDVARESVAGVRAPGGRQAGRDDVRKALRLPMAGEEGLGKLDAFLASSVLPCRVSGVVEPGRQQQDVAFGAVELVALRDLAAVVDQPAAALEPAVDEGNVRARVAEQLEHVPSGKPDDFRIRFAHPRFPSAAGAAPPSRRMGRRDNEALAEPTRAPAITSVVQCRSATTRSRLVPRAQRDTSPAVIDTPTSRSTATRSSRHSPSRQPHRARSPADAPCRC